MKLAFRQIEPFVKAPDPAVRAILVYGPDNGLMKERAATMGKTVVADLNDPFNVAALTADILLDDPARLSDEANAMSMMGGRRLIRIEDARDGIAPLLKDYLQSPNANALIILEAGELTTRSALRLLFEKLDNAAAVPCYVEDERDMAGFIRTTLQEQGFTIAGDAVQSLAAAITGDRQRARQEINKLVTYMGAEKKITADDVQACCGTTGEQSLDNLIYSVGGSNPKDAFRAYSTLIEEGLPVVTVLRALQNHFRRLHFTRACLDRGEAPELILKKLSPPVFFKQEAAFRAQMMRWSLPVLEKILARLATLEAQCKQTGMPVETLCSQAILGISRM